MDMAGPIARYYVARHTTSMLYSFELLMATAVLLLLTGVGAATGDWRLVQAFLLGSAVHVLLEGIAEGTGVRTTQHATLFGRPIRFPVTSLITGAFEGGVVVSVAYLLVLAVIRDNRLAGALFLALCLVFAGTGVAGVRAIHRQARDRPEAVSFTRRTMFASRALLVLAASYGGTLWYVLGRQGAAAGEARAFLLYYLGIVLFTTILAYPLHAGRLRYIEVERNGTFAVASAWEQVILMYGFNLPLEAGWYAGTFVVLHWLGLIPGPPAGLS